MTGKHADLIVCISIHAPPRGATLIRGFSVQSKSFQFTPLREGRRAADVETLPTMEISIHAPPRGATERKQYSAMAEFYFNSRPSARGDVVAPAGYEQMQRISIHAPPRGAT